MHTNTTPEELLFKLIENKNHIPHENNITFLKHLLENYSFNLNAKNTNGFTALIECANHE